MNNTDADDAQFGHGTEVDQAYDYSVTYLSSDTLPTDADMNVYANFAPNTPAYTVNFVATNGGTISATYQSYGVNQAFSSVTSATAQCDDGSPIYVTATPNAGYHFVNMNNTDSDDASWAHGTEIDSGGIDYSVTQQSTDEVDANSIMTVYANFAVNPPPTFTETFVANPTNGGVITPSGTGQYVENSWQTITAIPAAGYHFVNWTNTAGDDSPFGSSGCTRVSYQASDTMEIGTAMTTTAFFEQNTVQITLSDNTNPFLNYTVDGVPFLSPQTFTWAYGRHTFYS